MSWLYLLQDSLHPSKLNTLSRDISRFSRIIIRLTRETRTFGLYFTDQLGRSPKRASATIMQLIAASDTIYGYLVHMAPVWAQSDLSQKFRETYLQTLLKLEALLETCGRLDSETLHRLPITVYAAANIRMQLRERLETLRTALKRSDIDAELGGLLLSGLQALIKKKVLSRADVHYASSLIDTISGLENLTTENLENLLYQYDFNMPGFFNYCTKRCNRHLIDTPGLHDQLDVLIGWENRFNSLAVFGNTKWLAGDLSIRTQLTKFLTEKKRYTRQRVKLRKAEMRDSSDTEKDRIVVNLPVTQLGLFIRLFIVKGFLPNQDIGQTFVYYAKHFSTPKTPFISAESLQKKSTDVEFSTAKKMKGHLIGMINWLNEHYNVSNHRDS